MLFLKRNLPLIICFCVGVIFAVQYYIPHKSFAELEKIGNNWYIIISAFAVFLGVISISYVHIIKIIRNHPGWGYSVVFFLAFLSMTIIGIINGAESESNGKQTAFGWMYNNMLVVLQGTMFALLGFFIASAAFRAFRIKTTLSLLLLIAAILVMLGRIPFTSYLYNEFFRAIGLPNVPVEVSLTDITEWTMGTPNMAARRAVSLGITLGVIATSLKMIFGIERSWLGKD